MTEKRDFTLIITEQNLIIRIGKSEAEVTNNKRPRSRYCTVEANYIHRAASLRQQNFLLGM